MTLQKGETTKSQLQQAKTQMETCKTELEEVKSDPRLLMADLLARNQKLWAQNDFDRALEENQAVLAKYGHKPPADEALYGLGFIFAQTNNPKKDYNKSILYFKKTGKGISPEPASRRGPGLGADAGALGAVQTNRPGD